MLKYGPHGGVHGHLDKLEFVYWRHGTELADDPPICDLENPAWSGYFQRTPSHNTIVLDGQSQTPSTGERCLTFAPLPGFQVVELEATSAYAAQHARVRRLAVMTRDYVLLLDRVFSVVPHKVDFLIHGTGQDSALTSSVPLAPQDRALGDTDGYRFARVVGEGHAPGPFEARWKMGGDTGLRLMSLGGGQTTVMAARGFEGFRRGGTPLRSRLTYGTLLRRRPAAARCAPDSASRRRPGRDALRHAPRGLQGRLGDCLGDLGRRPRSAFR